MHHPGGRDRSSIPRASVVVALLLVASGVGTAGTTVAAAENATLVEYDLPEKMERDRTYTPTGTIENGGDEPITVMLEYQFDGEPAVGVEEELGAGESTTIDVWGISIEQVAEWRMTEIPPGTYDHGLVVLIKDERGTLEEVDSVSGRVEVLGATEGSADGGSASGGDDESPSTASSDDGSAAIDRTAPSADPEDGQTRGFFSNDPNSSFAFLDDPAALTWLGIMVSIVGIVAQLGWRN